MKDDYHYVDMGQYETRDGDHTKGNYNVVLPDGRRQNVDYYVDGYSGYVADVSYDGYDHKTYSAPAYSTEYSKPHYSVAAYKAPTYSAPAYKTSSYKAPAYEHSYKPAAYAPKTYSAPVYAPKTYSAPAYKPRHY